MIIKPQGGADAVRVFWLTRCNPYSIEEFKMRMAARPSDTLPQFHSWRLYTIKIYVGYSPQRIHPFN